MGLAKGVHEWLKVVRIKLVPLLVANTQILEVERSGMTHLCAERAPFGVGSAVGKLYQVEGVLDIRLQFLHGDVSLRIVILELAGQTATQDRERLRTNYFTQEEEFVEAQAIALEVVREEAVRECVLPSVFIYGAVLYGTNTVLPVITGFQVCSFHYTSAGEAENAGMEVCEGLCKVLAEDAFEGVSWNERYVLKVHCSPGILQEDAQYSLGISNLRLEFHLVFLPRRTRHIDCLLYEELVLTHRRGVCKFYADGAFTSVRHPGPDAEIVGFACLHAYPEESFVVKACLLVRVTRIGKPCIMRASLERTVFPDSHVSEGLPALQGVRKLE